MSTLATTVAHQPLLLESQINQFSASVTSTTNTPAQQEESQGRASDGNNQLTQHTMDSSTQPKGSQPGPIIVTEHQHNKQHAFHDHVTSALLQYPLSSLVSIGQLLSLLPQKLIQQIKAGKFVDFLDLPLTKGRQLAPTNYNSQLVLVQLQDMEQQSRLILDFLTWSQCLPFTPCSWGTHSLSN